MTQKITVFFGIAVMAAVLMAGLSLSQNAFAGVNENNGPEKIAICHVDQETGEEKTMHLVARAATNHLENHDGDYLGECTSCEQCANTLYEQLDECGNDTECGFNAINAAGECFKTCEDPDADLTTCINKHSDVLINCPDPEYPEIDDCLEEFAFNVNECLPS